MADEAILRTRFSDPVDFTCADGTAIPKGTLVYLSGDRTVAIATANSDVIGVVARDKIASDGRVTVPVFIDGIFDMTDSGSGITRGAAVAAAGSNEIKTAVAGDVGMETVGYAIETASADEIIQVLLKPGCNNNAYS
tara:strand:- start:1306 stop:1716 length:411 start_codon:yes stop_codon:yes gene_type:complete